MATKINAPFPTCRLRMKIYYDNNIVKRFNSTNATEVRIAAVVAHAQTLYKLPSLNTTVVIKVVSLKHINGTTWIANGNNLR